METMKTFLGVPAMNALFGLCLFAVPGWASAQTMAVSYYHLDAAGNILAVTDSSGNILEQHDYDVFGQEVNTQFGDQPKRFAGKERDPETGWDYFGARYYGSKIGRFTTVDPVYTIEENLLDPQRWNRYAYARNNPLRYVDPDGRTIVTYFGGLFTAFGSNLTGGLVPRPTSGDSDFQFGQFVGDTLSLAAAGYEASLGGGLVVGGGAATGTVVAAEIGVPAAVVGGVAVGHSVVFGGSALISLAKNTREGMGFTKGGKRQIDQANADKYGGQNVCENCGTQVQPGKRHEAGVTPPGNERQRDHIVPKSKGGRGTPDNGQVLCRECNIDKSNK